MPHDQSLAARHAHLERQISLEEARAHPMDSIIAPLKKEKLLLKDQLSKQA